MAGQGSGLQPRVMLLGPGGQLGRAVLAQPAAGLDLIPVPRAMLDLSDGTEIRRAVEEIRPDLILNAAAFNDIDRAEVEQDLALATNARAVESLARAAKSVGSAFLHISTDQVFDGSSSTPYTEVDHAAPLNMFGATKLLGDELAQLACPRTAIFRTSELHAPWGDNTVQQVLSAAGNDREFVAASDRVASPTSTLELAEICLQVARDLIDADPYADFWGVTNCASLGSCSEADLVREVMRLSGRTGARLHVAPLGDWPEAAARPKSTPLDCARLTRVFGIQPPTWQAQLEKTMSLFTAKAASEAA